MKKTSKPVKILSDGKYIRHMIRNGWEYVQRKNIAGIVAILAVTDEGKLLLVEQYREPVASRVLELPAGLAGDAHGRRREAFEEAARRELLEETGYAARKMKFLMEGPPSCGLSAEIVTFFQAGGLKKVGPGGGDEEEDILVHEVALAQAEKWLKKMEKKGLMVDPKVYSGLYFAMKNLS
ncbi:MAG TPA: DNA mismatch repair protein MutT [Verrucomicrobia bacterium]|nr:MAG: hypothetical protein A2X46_11245 [Lentisphaerae bacterium GWF2_57_35]HBA85079.1 DNA mismatch repair protein MutT [Verrucomicrobiota bacterium]